MTRTTLQLHTDFTPLSHTDWLTQIETSLKGAKLETLIRQTDDGLTRAPLAILADRHKDYPSFPRAGVALRDDRAWHIMAPVCDPEIAHANSQALEDLEGGASGLYMSLDPSGESGVAARTAADLKRLLEGVYTDLIPLALTPSLHNAQYAALFATQPELLKAYIHLGIDPVSEAFDRKTQPDFTALKSVLTWTKTNAPHWQVIGIDAASIHEAGGTDAQELAYMAASLVAVMRALAPDFSLETLAEHIRVSLASDRDAHLGIVKLRAARRIIARILQSFGLGNTALPIHSVSSQRMMQSQDPWTNMLRTMSAGFGAICGGADYISLAPFTDAIGLATPFGHRIARNMQILMMDESHLGVVSDPASGSYFHDQMTERLSEAAWTEFQAIESAGGIGAMCENGIFKQAIAVADDRRKSDAAPIVGVTLHPGKDLRAAKTRPRPDLCNSKALLMTDADFEGLIEQAQNGHQVGASA